MSLLTTIGTRPVATAKPVLVHHTTGCRKNVHARTRDVWAVSCPRCRRSRYVRRFWVNLRRTVKTLSHR